MADNTVLNSGSGGDVIATDEINSVKYQIVKAGFGVDGAVTLVSASDPFPVTAVVTGTVAATQSGTWNVGTVTTVTAVTSITNPVAVTGTFWQATQPVSGTFWQATQPVSLASVPSHDVTNAGTFAVQAVCTATNLDIRDLTSVSDSVAAVQSGTWNVTNVSGTISLPTGASTAANQASEIALLTTIDGDTGTLAGAVAGTEMQVDVVAALPAGTNNIGDVDAIQSGTWNIGTVTTVTAVTAISNALPAGTNAIGKLAANSGVDIGDVDVTSVIPGTGATNLGKAVDAVAGATDTGVAPLAVRDDALSALTPVEGDYVTLRVDANGALWTHDDALDAALSGSELQVDIVASLPAGTNAIGKLSANSGVDIGDVDILSIAAGDNNIGNVDIVTMPNVSLTDISAGEYETVAASQTAQVLGATGATGDYLAGVLVVPASTSPGNVIILDNATSITVFTGGASSVSNLVPFLIPLGIKSVSGAWKVTTGANVSCIGIGNFTA